jgi:2'-5' RNA ligase
MPRGSVARLFVAVDLPASEREELAAWGREAVRAVAGLSESRSPPPLRAIDIASIHLTLCFLGSRPVGEVEVAAAVLPACAAHACELEIGAPLWLPRRRPQALAVAVQDEPEGELERLQAQLRDRLAAATAWEPERRRFRPHVTVVRVRGGSRRRRGARAGLDSAALTAVSLPATPRLRFMAETLTLYRSVLDPAGARYEPLAGCRLLPPDGG